MQNQSANTVGSLPAQPVNPTPIVPAAASNMPQFFKSNRKILMLAAAVVVLILISLGLFLAQKASQKQKQMPNFTISVEPGEVTLGPKEKKEFKVIVTSVGGFADDVILTPIFTPGIGEPFTGVLGSLILIRTVRPTSANFVSTVVYVSTADEIPKIEGASPAKNLKIEGKSGDITQYSNSVTIKTKVQ